MGGSSGVSSVLGSSPMDMLQSQGSQGGNSSATDLNQIMQQMMGGLGGQQQGS